MGANKRNHADEAYVTLFANSEAINLVSTLISPQNARMMKVMANKYKNNIDGIEGFYKYLETLNDTYYNGTELVSNSLYDFPDDDPKYFPITPTNLNDGKVYTNKGNVGFSGLYLYDNIIEIQTLENEGSSMNPIDNFTKDSKENFLRRFFWGNNAENYFDYTQENIIFIKD